MWAVPDVERLQLLLDRGADVNAQVTGTKTYSMRIMRAPSANEGRTALHMAAQDGRALGIRRPLREPPPELLRRRRGHGEAMGEVAAARVGGEAHVRQRLFGVGGQVTAQALTLFERLAGIKGSMPSELGRASIRRARSGGSVKAKRISPEELAVHSTVAHAAAPSMSTGLGSSE